MLTSRFHLPGLLAVLLALMALVGAGAAVPRYDPVAVRATLCHAGDNGHAPAHGPSHPSSDCPACPLCATAHAQTVALLSDVPAMTSPPDPAVLRTELPPPSTAPPAPRRRPCQPRAPPTLS